MNQSQRKRRKLDDKSIWGDEDDEDFLRPDSLSILSQYDGPVRDKDKENQNNTSDKPKTNAKSGNSPARRTLTNRPSTSAIAQIQTPALFDDEVIEETPVYKNIESGQSYVLREEFEKLQNENARLRAEKNVSLAETRVIRDRYERLAKEAERDKMKIPKLIESSEREAKAVAEKYRQKIDTLETNIQFKDLEVKQMHQRFKRRRTEEPVESMETSVQCEINAPVNRTKVETCRGEITIVQLLAHLNYDSDETWTCRAEEPDLSTLDISDDNIIPSSVNTSPSSDSDDSTPPDINLPNKTNNDAPPTDLKLTVIHAFLNATNSGTANIDAGLEVCLAILEKRLHACAETWQTRLCTKPASKSSSPESIFSSATSSTSTSSIAPMTQSEFAAFERDELLVLSLLSKIMKARPKLPKMDAPRRGSSAAELFSATFQRDGELVNLARNGDTLSESLVRLVQLPSCEKFAEKHREEVTLRVLRLLCAVLGFCVPVEPVEPVQEMVESGGVLFCLEVGGHFEVLEAALELFDACVDRFGCLGWICGGEKEACYVLRFALLCRGMEKEVGSEDGRVRLLGKIIDSMMGILRHPEGTAWLLREADRCNCRCEILNQLILALCTEATNCNADTDGNHFQVLSNGMKFLHELSSMDPQFQVRRQMVQDCNLLVQQMMSLYQKDGRTMSVVERQQLEGLTTTEGSVRF